MIKVEHEDELMSAEEAAFYVMGVGHGHLDGKRVTTFTLNVNEKLLSEYRRALADYIADPESTGEEIKVFEGGITRLLVGEKASRRTCVVTQSARESRIFLVVYKRPEERK